MPSYLHVRMRYPPRRPLPPVQILPQAEGFALGCVLVNGRPVGGGPGARLVDTASPTQDWVVCLDGLSEQALGCLIDASARDGRIEVVTSDGGSGRIVPRFSRAKREYRTALIGHTPWRIDPMVHERRVDMRPEAASPHQAAALATAIRTRRVGALWTTDGLFWDVDRVLEATTEGLTVLLAVDGQERHFPSALLVWWVPAV